MPIRESEAIVLRSFPLGEGDRLVSFLSRNAGKMRGVASGARKPKSRFGSTLEPLSYIRIWFFERETRELVRINQCDLIESFLDAQRDYVAGLVLALTSEVTEAVLGDKEIAEPNFRLLLLVARCLKAGVNPLLALAYFAIWTVRLGGWLPPMDRCGRCGAELRGAAFTSHAQGLLCSLCRVSGQAQISKASLDVIGRILKESLDGLMKANLNVDGIAELNTYALNMVELRVEKRLQSRKLLIEELERAK